MTRHSGLLPINCTSCGAGLNVLGGGRVVVQVCSYCGAELDAQDNYKTLHQFVGQKRPKTPFSIGMTGSLFGAEFTIIGLIEHTENWGGLSYTWIDHQVFSPTHGYAWLTLEDGHLIFTRRYRGSAWISERLVQLSEYPPTVFIKDHEFKYYETTTSEITYVEGEFNWRPRLNDRTTTVSAMSESMMLEFSTTNYERETYLSVYVPIEDVKAAFNIDLPNKRKRVHPLEPFVKGPNYDFVVRSTLVFASVSLVMAFLLSARPGDMVLQTQVYGPSDLPVAITIPLEANSQLTRITVSADVRNSWAYLDFELEDPEGDAMFQTGRTVEFYSGRDSEGSWSEGHREASITFRPQMTGDHVLNLELSEQGLWGSGHSDPRAAFSTLEVTARTHISSGRWAYTLAAFFGLLHLYQLARKWLHRRARWSGTDWVDED